MTPFKQWVRGSNPRRVTRKFRKITRRRGFAELFLRFLSDADAQIERLFECVEVKRTSGIGLPRLQIRRYPLIIAYHKSYAEGVEAMEPLTVIAEKVVTEAGKAAVGAAGEAIGGAVANAVTDKVAANAVTDKNPLDALVKKLSLSLKDYFRDYLRKAAANYDATYTLATGMEERSITGKNGVYVEVGVSMVKGGKETEIAASSVEALLNESAQKRILIEGSGGMGKSMLMKYLFLKSIRPGTREKYIPVFLELRRVNRQSRGEVSIPELVYACMENQGVKLPKEYFPDSLNSARYLFLMDGFDEVREELSAEVAEKIQAFSAPYTNQHAFIVTSRSLNDFGHTPFQNFTRMKSMPLNQEQAALLAEKLAKTWTNPDLREKADEFCRQLRGELYEKRKFFAQNPLLLSMMFLTFTRNSTIPAQEAEFYKESYEALFFRHDAQNKGQYVREFQCGDLEKSDFTKLFSRFCFQSYLDEQYEFAEEDALRENGILDYLQASIDHLKLQVDKKKYLSDLCRILCMIVRDGNVYRFAHRSFQEYFAAVYTSGLEDDAQKAVLKEVWELYAYNNFRHQPKEPPFLYWRTLFQVDRERFIANALEEHFRELLYDAERSDNPDIFLLKNMFSSIHWIGKGNHWRAYVFLSKMNVDDWYIAELCVAIGIVQSRMVDDGFLQAHGAWWDIEFDDPTVTPEVFARIAKGLRIDEFRATMRQWLDDLDKAREAVKRKNKRRDFHRNL